MNKLNSNDRVLNLQTLMSYLFAVAILCLTVTWGIESAAKALFRLALI